MVLKRDRISQTGARKATAVAMQHNQDPAPSDPPWDPISEIPETLSEDGSNYVEWVSSLLDGGIDVDPRKSFAMLVTHEGQPLLADSAAEFLDTQMVIARAAADGNGHDLGDVVLCCKPGQVDSGKIADELLQVYFTNASAALARAKAIGEICDIAEDFCSDAWQLKWVLSQDEALPKAVRDALGNDDSE